MIDETVSANNCVRTSTIITWDEAVEAVCSIAENAVHFGKEFTEEQCTRLEKVVKMIRKANADHAKHVAAHPGWYGK